MLPARCAPWAPKSRWRRLLFPHWVRGAETGELVSWPGQAPGTTQKVVLTALGGSVATPPEGITAEVVVVDDWKHCMLSRAIKRKARSCFSIIHSTRSWPRKGTG